MKQWQKHIDKAENFLADDHFPVSEGTLPSPLQKLKRDMEREALKRLEESARTHDDFQNVVTWWNRLDDNRERKERYHEISRSGDQLPLDFGASKHGKVFPASLGHVHAKQIQAGDFFDIIYDCPHQIHQLVTEVYLSKILFRLSDARKELLFGLVVLQCKTQEMALIKNQSDRNIRQVKNTLFRKIHSEMMDYFITEKPVHMTPNERKFVQKNT